jgi:uncharacterized protein DUF4383
MARFWAQLFTPVFLVVTLLGVVMTAADKGSPGKAGGNLGNLTLHFTWPRNLLDLAVLGACVWIGFAASRRSGRLAAIAVGAVLLALGIAGFVVGDNDPASKGFLGMHFPAAINVLDVIAGLLGLLSGLGTIDEADAAAG